MMKARVRSFKYAIDGIIHSYSEPNMLIHGIAAVLVILTGILVKLNPVEWAILFIAIGFVKVAETLNTALEKLVDLVSPDQNEKAGVIKDIAAGAVLIASIAAIGVACMILLPKVLELLN